MYKKVILLCLCISLYAISNAQVTEIYTDYTGFWKSTLSSVSTIKPDTSHNLLAFTRNSKVYSTGVDNTKLVPANGISVFMSTVFKALPITYPIGGTIAGGSSTYIATGALNDGVTNGYSNPVPNLRIADVLTDGINGLDIGTGITDLPMSAVLKFNVNAIDIPSTLDTIPDILFSQISSPGTTAYQAHFEDASGALVGNVYTVVWGSALGNNNCDLYNLSATTTDLSVITSGNTTNQNGEIRLSALQFSDFGINITNATLVKKLIIVPDGSSDPAFVAYNTASFTVTAPVVTTQPKSQFICTDPTKTVNLSVVATSGSILSYQWRKNSVNIPNEISSTYSINRALASDSGRYDVIISDGTDAIISKVAFITALNNVIPASATIPTGNIMALSVNASTSGYQWQKNGTDIAGATASSYNFNPLLITDGGSFTVNIANANNAACPLLTSTASLDTITTTLYSKQTGAINIPATWGVYADGGGIAPATFLRPEHTFSIANQATSTSAGDLTIAGTLDITNSTTTISGNTTLNVAGLIAGASGKLVGTATSNLTVGGVSDLNFDATGQILENLTIASNGTATLNSPLSLTAGSTPGILIVNAGGTLATGGNLTLKSDANGTAFVGNSDGTVSGAVTIERYMPARRAWRLIGAPIVSSITPTINAAWQEGATTSSSDPTPGFGTHITGGTVAQGFDQSPNNNPSFKFYNGSSFVGVANTDTVPVTQYPACFLFVRGNRSYDIVNAASSLSPLATVLRVTGNINQGTQAPVNVSATGYTLAVNPYTSPIDFALVQAASTNVLNRFYMWDPQLGSQSSSSVVGAYVVVEWNGSTYTKSPGTANVTSIIQGGQGFFLQSDNSTTSGSLIINESHKNSTTSVVPFGKVVGNPTLKVAIIPDASIAMDLKIIEANNSESTADGVLEHYNSRYNNGLDNGDAYKFSNSNENLSILSNNALLTIERRQPPVPEDTLHLKVTGLVNKNYSLNIALSNFNITGVQPQLFDTYLNNRTLLNTADTVKYHFTITADAASKAADRFGIAFKSLVVVPVKFFNVSAHATDETSIAINWNIGNESSKTVYEVQWSEEANNFTTISTLQSKNTGSTIAYLYNHLNVVTFNNYYRIKSTEASGLVTYSEIVNVLLKKSKAISIWPNPVTGNTIKLRLQDIEKGKYQYAIINSLGQVVVTGAINHTANQSLQTIRLTKKLAVGNYEFSMSMGTVNFKTKMIVQNL
ncbi:MAG: immunoglobulin domain-containing protein [Ferruginibacter sp.]|nr:immunoglobulin domain-containing protein [Ferruginibacter sp.]